MSNGNRTGYKKVFKEAESIKASFIVDLDKFLRVFTAEVVSVFMPIPFGKCFAVKISRYGKCFRSPKSCWHYVQDHVYLGSLFLLSQTNPLEQTNKNTDRSRTTGAGMESDCINFYL